MTNTKFLNRVEVLFCKTRKGKSKSVKEVTQNGKMAFFDPLTPFPLCHSLKSDKLWDQAEEEDFLYIWLHRHIT